MGLQVHSQGCERLRSQHRSDREIIHHYESLWKESVSNWSSGEIPSVKMRYGRPTTPDYCITTVAQLIRQSNAPVTRLLELIERLKNLAGKQFYYPEPSLHITLLGCTQREPTREPFTKERIEAIRGACERVLFGRDKVEIRFRGVGIAGPQVFIQGFPNSRTWADLRNELMIAMRGIGENPIAYENKLPVHLNIARITSPAPRNVHRLLKEITALRFWEMGVVEINVVDLLITDFVLSKKGTSLLNTFELKKVTN